MNVRPLEGSDLEWAVRRLALRRAALVPFAPVLWAPADDAAAQHRRHLSSVLNDFGGVGVRSDDGLMIAVPSPGGWTVDDAVVADGMWSTIGAALWGAIAERVGDAAVRFVCPRPETERAEFARSRDLTVDETWWHLALPDSAATVQPASGDAVADPASVALDGCVARLVRAPAVYNPGGPVLFASGVDPTALPGITRAAVGLGCPLIVIAQSTDDTALAAALASSNYTAHCDFFTGRL